MGSVASQTSDSEFGHNIATADVHFKYKALIIYMCIDVRQQEDLIIILSQT